MKRLFDIIVSVVLTLLLSPLLIGCFLLVRLTSKGHAIHWSKRIGKNNVIFLMPKFRSMRTDAPQLATHLLQSSESFITPVGHFLRKTSLDELPQLLSVLWGDMSIVGPRPALFNQDDLVELRTLCNVHLHKPGITGWAQVNGRDELEIPAKVELDKFYVENSSLAFDIKILLMSFLKVIRKDGISH